MKSSILGQLDENQNQDNVEIFVNYDTEIDLLRKQFVTFFQD